VPLEHVTRRVAERWRSTDLYAPLAQTQAMAAETESTLQRSPWLFLVGALVFLGSAGLFVFDLANGNSTGRGVVANAAAAALVVALLGLDTLSNPESHIESRGEAFRAVLFFYAMYLVVAGVVVFTVAVLGQPDPRLGGASIAAGGVMIVITYLTGGAESGLLSRLTTLAGLLGLVLVVGSLAVFAYDLLTGGDVLRGIVINGVGAALFILWTAYDMPSDPDSGVETVSDAFGVCLLFYGGYLLAAGAVVTATGLAGHERVTVGLMYLVLAVLPLLLGFFLAPPEALRQNTELAATSGDGETTEEAVDEESSD
jgi:hypothetical protein